MNKYAKYILIKNISGFSLLEVVVSVGLVSLIMFALMTMTQIVNTSNIGQQIVIARNDIVNNVRQQASRYSNLDNSAIMTNTLGSAGIVPNIGTPNTLNYSDMLARCLPNVNTVPGSCNRTNMDDAQKGNLFYLGKNNSQNPAEAVAGEDVFYTLTSRRCTQAEAVNPKLCPLFARVWAEPFCLNLVNNCNKAMSLTIRYSVGVRSDYPNSASYATAEGQVYIPLQKGIQMTRVLNENNGSINNNPAGIYVVKKNNGTLPSADPTGFRFEVTVGNPTGLVSMKLQYRALTGTSAYGLGDANIPAPLELLPWSDVLNPPPAPPFATAPCGAGGPLPWSITNLNSATPGQILVFGTMNTANGGANQTSQKFCFSNNSGATVPHVDWRKDLPGTALIAPVMKSGFYQFRVVATDTNSATVESTNYVTIRIISSPRIFTTGLPPAPVSWQRNCTAANTASFSYMVGDDEGLSALALTRNGVPLGTPAPVGTFLTIPVTVDLTQPQGVYNYNLTASNFFTNNTYNGITPIPVVLSTPTSLTEVPPPFNPFLSSNPTKIRINNTADITKTYATGSCCSTVPTINWTYPNVPAAGGVMLSGPANSAVTCSLAGNIKTCNSTINVTGIKEGPTVATPNVSSLIDFGASPDSACNTPTAANNYFQVVTIPNIYFYTAESLWLDVPTSALGLIKPKSPSGKPRIYVRSDFDPANSVTVHVVRATNPAHIECVVTFNAGAGLTPVTKFCDVDPVFSGDYALAPGGAGIQMPMDPPGVYVAKIAGQISHRICNANLTSLIGYPSPKAVGTSLPFWNSPWDAPGGIQNPKNDTNLWPVGSNKNLRCYDNWTGVVPAFNDSHNKQDFYDVKVTRDGNPPLVLPSPLHHTGFSIGYSSYIFPNNVDNSFNSVDFNSPNAPLVFVVTNSGTPSNLKWKYQAGAGQVTETPFMPWSANLAPQLCTGPAALSNIGLYSSPMMGFVDATTAMKATNHVSSSAGIYSYVFMCSYGRWNPKGSAFTSWVD